MTKRRSGGRAAGLALVAALVLSSCGGNSPEEVEAGQEGSDSLPESGSTDAPFDTWSSPAPLGAGLAILHTEPSEFVEHESGVKAAQAAVRLADGTWTELPLPPPLWNPSLVEVGDTIAIAGLECDAVPCETVRVGGAILSPGMEEWSPLDFGNESIGLGEDLAMVRVGEGVVGGLGRRFMIEPDGSVVALPRPPATNGSGNNQVTVICQTDVPSFVQVELTFGSDSGFEVTRPEDLDSLPTVTEPPTDPEGEVSQVRVLDLRNIGGGWVDGELPAVGPIEADPLTLCAGEGPVVATPGRELRHSGQGWTEASVALPGAFDETSTRVNTSTYRLSNGEVVLVVSRGVAQGSSLDDPQELPGAIYIRRLDGAYDLAEEDVELSAGFFVAGERAYLGLADTASEIRELDLSA